MRPRATWTGFVAGLSLAGAGVACSDGHAGAEAPVERAQSACDAGGAHEVRGLAVSLAMGSVTVVESAPALASVGDNRWTLLLDDDHGHPVAGASLSALAFMPVHGHASVKVPLSTDLGDGEYRLEPLSFSMPGSWTVDVSVLGEHASGDATFTLCVER